MKARKLRKLLRGLGYHRVPGRGHGSHELLRADGYSDILFAFHSKDDVPGGLIRNILVKQVGMTREEAEEAVRNA